MSVLFKEIILRMLCTGVICTVALILAGEGVYKEPVRLCCAGVVIIMLLTPYNHKIPDIASVLNYKNELKNYVTDETDKAKKAEYDQVILKIKESVNKRLSDIGINCSIDMRYKLSDNTFVIEKAEIVGKIDESDKAFISTLLETEYGIDKTGIFFVEAGE